MSRLKLNNISLDYFHYTRKPSLKKTMINSVFKIFNPEEDELLPFRRALDGIDLEINSGDRIGLLGKNGSGKSTLLKVLAGIYQPTYGSLEVKGSISSLLNIGVGLNEDATGYENIILMGILQGKTKKEMKARIREIEEFTELKEFLKVPVRTYSSGMRLRLAFGIATSLDSDILLVDEVIGVGDHSFVDKAQKRIENLIYNSNILMLASHSIDIIRSFCNKSLILEQGKCVFFGDLEQGIALYESHKDANPGV